MVVRGVAKTYRWLATVLRRRYYTVQSFTSLGECAICTTTITAFKHMTTTASITFTSAPSPQISAGRFSFKISGNFGSAVNGKRLVGSSDWKIPWKSGKSRKVGPLSRLEHSEISCSFTRFWYFIPVAIAWRANDVNVTNLPFLSEFCHFCHFNDKRQTNMTFQKQNSDKSEIFANVNRPFPSSPGLCFKTRVGAQSLI